MAVAKDLVGGSIELPFPAVVTRIISVMCNSVSKQDCDLGLECSQW